MEAGEKRAHGAKTDMSISPKHSTHSISHTDAVSAGLAGHSAGSRRGLARNCVEAASGTAPWGGRRIARPIRAEKRRSEEGGATAGPDIAEFPAEVRGWEAGKALVGMADREEEWVAARSEGSGELRATS
eukprot:723811-Rhodomonas_salina.2